MTASQASTIIDELIVISIVLGGIFGLLFTSALTGWGRK